MRSMTLPIKGYWGLGLITTPAELQTPEVAGEYVTFGAVPEGSSKATATPDVMGLSPVLTTRSMVVDCPLAPIGIAPSVVEPDTPKK
jgi:hypothetical protein